MFIAGTFQSVLARLPGGLQFVRSAPHGFNWQLYYSPSRRLYYKLTPVRGGVEVVSGHTVQACCGS